MNDLDQSYARNELLLWIEKLPHSGIYLMRPPEDGAPIVCVRRASSAQGRVDPVHELSLHAQTNLRAMIDLLLSEGRVILFGNPAAPQLVSVVKGPPA